MDWSRPPRVLTRGAVGGGPGGINIGRLLPGLLAGAAFGRDTIASGVQVGGALTGGVSARLEQLLFGDTAPKVRGATRAAEEVSQRLGLAKGLGLVDQGTASSLFEVIRGLREAEEIGKRELEVDFKGQIGTDTAEGLLQRMVDILEQIRSALP